MSLRYGLVRRAFNTALVLLALLPAAAAARQLLVLAYGDSLTAGYQLAPGDSFPAQLQAALRKDGLDVLVHNAGVSGDTTTQGRARMAWVLGGLKARPDLIILELGANDSLRGVNPKITRDNLDAMLAEFNKRGHKVLLAGMLAPRNMGADYVRAFDPIYPALAKKHGVPLYPFFMDGVIFDDRLKLPDGMHPTRQGVAVIVQRIKPHVIKALRK